MTEDDVYRAYRKTLAQLGHVSHNARYHVYRCLMYINGQIWVSRNADNIKVRLDEIEKETLSNPMGLSK